MKTKSNIKKTWLGTLFVVVLVAAAMSVTVFAGDAEAAEHTSKMYATAWSLVPPLVAIILALITKEVYSSLFIGIVVGGLFYANFSPKLTYLTIFTDITDGGMLAKLSDSDNVGILIFLVILGIMVALMNKAGGSAAYGRWAVKAIKTRKGALLSTFLLGVLVFTAPVAFATGAAQTTSNIFKAWCRMFGGQIFLLLMNAWCLRLFITMVGTFLANPLSL